MIQGGDFIKVGAGLVGGSVILWWHAALLTPLTCRHLCFGAVAQGDGTGAMSIYGSRFADENFIGRHTGPGLLSMVCAAADDDRVGAGPPRRAVSRLNVLTPCPLLCRAG